MLIHWRSFLDASDGISWFICRLMSLSFFVAIYFHSLLLSYTALTYCYLKLSRFLSSERSAFKFKRILVEVSAVRFSEKYRM